MLVVMSDLHFQDTQTDRLEDPVGSLQVSGERNVDPEAFRQTFAALVDLARRNRAKELIVVLAGDIFDLHRSQHWFTDGKTIRPYGEHPPALWEPVALTILEGIFQSNAEVCHIFRTLVRKHLVPAADPSGDPLATLPATIPFHFAYLPGNHDRLVHLSPALQAPISDLLDLDVPPDRPFPQTLTWEEYGVFIRHGHEYDPYNFAGHVPEDGPFEVDPQAYTRAPLGDYVTIDIASRLAFEYRRRYIEALYEGPEMAQHQRIYSKLLELDDLRPQGELVSFLERDLDAEHEHVWRWLRPVLVEVVHEALGSTFFGDWLTRLNPPGPDLQDLLRYQMERTAWQHLIRLFEDRLVRCLVALLTRREPVASRPWQRALREPALLHAPYRYVVAGHTHKPTVEFLRQRPNGHHLFFFDTGTWRERIAKCRDVCTFARAKALSYVVFYRPDEDPPRGGGGKQYSFDYWSGFTKKELL